MENQNEQPKMEEPPRNPINDPNTKTRIEIPFIHPITFAQSILNFPLLPYQAEFLKSCKNKNRIIGIWARQSGKSTTIAIYCLWHALTIPDSKILLISPTQEQSNLLFQKITHFLYQHPFISNKCTQNIKSDQIQFTNQSLIKSLPVGPYGATIRGHSATVIVIEESGIIKTNIVNEVILPMGAAQKNLKILQIGTPRGRNHFYEATQSSHYTIHKYDYTHPLKHQLFTQEYIQEQKNTQTQQQFLTEYGCEFIEESDLYYPPSIVDPCIDPSVQKPTPEPNQTYYLGVDFARTGEDSTVFTIAEISQHPQHNHRIINIIETQNKLLTDTIGRIQQLHNTYHFKKIILDETGLGAGPTDILKEKLGGIIQPLTFTLDTKQDLYSQLKILFEQKKITIPDHPKLYYQLTDFRYHVLSTGKVRLTHADNKHDDFVASLALALYNAAKTKPSYHMA